jgi:hypothetical protein
LTVSDGKIPSGQRQNNERRGVIRDAVEETLEDIALARAIQEGETSKR